MSSKEILVECNGGNAKGKDCLTFQLIDEEGHFNSSGLKKFAEKVKLTKYDGSYAIVAIIGPQSSGKSTLLNHSFGTNFKVMNKSLGRKPTTKGIDLAKSPDVDPLTLVMDIEGNDGGERGEDGTAFGKQSALFALAVADVILINMWCNDIGRHQGANMPLLSDLFQQALIHFSDKPRNVKLMFVVRDIEEMPEDILEADLRRDLKNAWASIRKPKGSNDIQLTDFFSVEVQFLPHYKYQRVAFDSTVETLKQRIIGFTAPGGLAGDWENIWKDIKENKDLKLPALKVMVANIRSEDISKEKYNSFKKNEDWCKLKNSKFRFMSGFGGNVNSIVNACLSEYDAETRHFDEEVRREKKEELVNKMLQHVKPVYEALLDELCSQSLKKFKQALDRCLNEKKFPRVHALVESYLLKFDKDSADLSVELANWDTSRTRDTLESDMNSHVDANREQIIKKIIGQYFQDLFRMLLSLAKNKGKLLKLSLTEAGDAFNEICKVLDLKVCEIFLELFLCSVNKFGDWIKGTSSIIEMIVRLMHAFK